MFLTRLAAMLVAFSYVAQAQVTKDAGCGTSKGCFTDCQGTTCTFAITWQTSSTTSAIYTISATVPTTSSYIAMGFSSDASMGDDTVMGCTSGSPITKFTANNVGTHVQMVTDTEVLMSSSSNTGGVLTCTFTRSIAGTTAEPRALDQSWTILFARGSASVSGSSVGLSYHGDDYFASNAAAKVTDKVDLQPQPHGNPMYKAHGCLMVVAWIFFSSVGIVTARFYKPIWTQSLCSQKAWFQIRLQDITPLDISPPDISPPYLPIHRFVMVAALCATAIGFIIIFAEEQDWSDMDGEEEYLVGHPIMGVIVMILTLANPIMALFRPHPGTPKRPIFNWAHLFVGVSAHILAVITIFFGVRISTASVPYGAVYILAAYVAWQLCVEIVLELISCYARQKVHKEEYDMSNPGANDTKADTDVSDKKIELIKKIIFCVHCVVVAGLAAAVMGVIGAGEGGGDGDD
ncbi:putative ferric-chelate reductase 1 [Physella acuta]|uniref:putative ferric-chelate reductase 1 n=1 Tax=Physella acuta TaxID=109671 RepID=UPI0027DBD169|nr:putative ferric-chelate reductase 1 [Physella acuta]